MRCKLRSCCLFLKKIAHNELRFRATGKFVPRCTDGRAMFHMEMSSIGLFVLIFVCVRRRKRTRSDVTSPKEQPMSSMEQLPRLSITSAERKKRRRESMEMAKRNLNTKAAMMLLRIGKCSARPVNVILSSNIEDELNAFLEMVEKA
uniref:Uncharacterized protein n=1 Tax=Trichuris muris TaxID=70415 RepID=A0A5S6QF91_TRIMR